MIARREDEIVATTEVKQPIDRRATDLPKGAVVSEVIIRAPGDEIDEKSIVYRQVRSDTLGALRAAEVIDEAQYIAGRRWQRAYELTEIGGGKGIDTTRPAVDGGRMPDPLPEHRWNASEDLKSAKSALGWWQSSIVEDILGKQLSFADLGIKYGNSSEFFRRHINHVFRQALETLTVVFELAQKVRS